MIMNIYLKNVCVYNYGMVHTCVSNEYICLLICLCASPVFYIKLVCGTANYVVASNFSDLVIQQVEGLILQQMILLLMYTIF